jgi:hypothetical protein
MIYIVLCSLDEDIVQIVLYVDLKSSTPIHSDYLHNTAETDMLSECISPMFVDAGGVTLGDRVNSDRSYRREVPLSPRASHHKSKARLLRQHMLAMLPRQLLRENVIPTCTSSPVE